VEVSTTVVIIDTLPAPTVDISLANPQTLADEIKQISVTIATTIDAPLTSVAQTITADALTSTQTITPSPVTVTSETTTYTTTIATATTIVVDNHEFEFHLANGPNSGCFYDASLQSGFIKEADDGNCADNCAREYCYNIISFIIL